MSIDKSAVNIGKDNLKFLDSNCYFQNCRKASGEGAAIYLNGNSALIQRRFCSIGGYVYGYQGSHSCCRLKPDSDLPNLVIESSIAQCKGDRIYSVLFFYYGKTGVYSTNSSYNEVYHGSGYQNYNPIEESITNYSSFCHNKNAHNFVLYHNNGFFKDFKCNLVDNEGSNSRTSFSIDFLNNKQSLTVDSCSFVGPYGYAKLFNYASSSVPTITVRNCNIDDTSRIGRATTSNIKANDIINILGHYSTFNFSVERL